MNSSQSTGSSTNAAGNGPAKNDASSDHAGSPKAQAILDASLELFAEKGYDGTAVPLIAEKAGVGAGTIYRYFESKEVLVNILYSKWRTIFRDRLLADVPADAPPRDVFSMLWNRMADFQREFPQAYAFLEFYNHTYLNEENIALTESIIDFLAGFLRRGQDHGVFRKVPPGMLIFMVLGAFVGLVRAENANRLELTEEAIKESEEICWRAVT
ncbi:MAG: TetR family transcriptional regulator [bacterium]|nr:TetR family transcriptional regulator [bacterium]